MLLNRGARLINTVREDRQIAEAIAEQTRREDCDKNYQREIDNLIALKNPEKVPDWKKALDRDVPKALTEEEFKVKVDEQRSIRRKCLEGKN